MDKEGISETDLAYAAGLIDGDGSIGINKSRDRQSRRGYKLNLKVSLYMTDSAAPMWMKMRFGGHLWVRESRSENWRSTNIWGIASIEARNFLEMIIPYLKTKQKQAEIAIEFQSMEKHRTMHKGSSIPIPKANVLVEAESILYNSIRELNTRGKR